jgi:hypothetical protein
MVVDLRKTQIFVRHPAQPLHSRFQRQLTASDLSQKFSNVSFVHNIFR